jgi:hypothetical protein
MDIDECPDEALPWLGQFVGVVTPGQEVGESDAVYWARVRDYIRSTPGFRRASPAAIISAAQKHLTGSKTVILRERQGGAWRLEVRTLTSETPSTLKVLQAILDHKPAGVILDYNTITGWDWQGVYTSMATYQTIFTTFTTYQGFLTNTPGT